MRKTTREMQDAKREQALADIREKVASGALTIRQMTVEERARYAREASDRRPSRRPG